MPYTTRYQSPMGEMFLACDEVGLVGLWFKDQKYFAMHLAPDHEEKETPVLQEAKRWLDVYFSGQEPDFMPPLHLIGTKFQEEVWDVLRRIPYGQTITYGQIAKQIAQKRGLAHMSAQAVGGAVGHNPISVLVPCHRVVGTDGSLTGYAGGVERKQALLALEGAAVK